MSGRNRLGDAPSPYLHQHKDNPVHWWEWSDEAFAEATRRDVPIFLSIGYATCHWCHVMAHESFEDDEVAALLNEHFVCIKVDREERPDLDAAYMAACQASGQRGGWPLTAVLDHQRRPWMIGTYFPKQTRGRIGMLDLVPKLHAAWTEQRSEVESSAAHLLDHVAGSGEGSTRDTIRDALLDDAAADLKRRFDPEHGGFGGAPKFPSPHQLQFLLRHHKRTGDDDALHMVQTTLHAMAAGGLHDHVGGGFHRYSTDTNWHLPHFEKMLYDQATLLLAYTECYQVTGDSTLASVMEALVGYVLRDLRHPDGGFYCAEDADSDGEEGTFYIWTADELRNILGNDAEAFMETYGVQEAGNFHDEATREPVPANILHRRPDINSEAHRNSLDQLLVVRAKRKRPLLDDKILTDWNGLMIAALAKAGAALQRDNWVDAAAQAAQFIQTHLRTDDGALRHRWHEGRVDNHAFLDDHAFLGLGLLELYHATGATTWLDAAMDVGGRMLERHAEESGRLRLTAKDAEDLVVQSTSAYDGAMPSGTAIAVQVLERLGRLTGDSQWTEAAWNAALHVDGLAAHPTAYLATLQAVPALLGAGQEVVITGAGDDADAMLREMRTGFHPDAVVLRHDGAIAGLPEWVTAHDASADAAYVCQNQACNAPVHDLDTLRLALD